MVVFTMALENCQVQNPTMHNMTSFSFDQFQAGGRRIHCRVCMERSGTRRLPKIQVRLLVRFLEGEIDEYLVFVTC